jgi:MYXO-CTERM domain-containing protein
VLDVQVTNGPRTMTAFEHQLAATDGAWQRASFTFEYTNPAADELRFYSNTTGTYSIDGVHLVPGSCCGNGVCEGGESCATCSADCPTGAGQTCCRGALVTGDCCTSDDCTGGQSCVANLCAGPTTDGGPTGGDNDDGDVVGASVGISGGCGCAGSQPGDARRWAGILAAVLAMWTRRLRRRSEWRV